MSDIDVTADPTGTPSSQAPEPGMKWCGWHSTYHPITEFGFKNKATGTLQSKCKQAQREYSAAHYAANRQTRIVELKQRSRRVRAGLHAMIEAARTNAVCARCGGRDALKADHPDGPVLWEAERREVSADTMHALLADPHLVWVCRTCRGRELGTSRRGIPAQGRTMTTQAAVADVLAAAESPMRAVDVHASVCAMSGPVSDEFVREVLGAMCASGQVAQTTRGRYTLRVEG